MLWSVWSFSISRSLHVFDIMSILCNVFYSGSDAAHQIRSPVSVLCRRTGFGIDVHHRPLCLSVTLSSSSSYPQPECLSLTHFLFSFPSLSPAFFTFYSQAPDAAVSHFCSCTPAVKITVFIKTSISLF